MDVNAPRTILALPAAQRPSTDVTIRAITIDEEYATGSEYRSYLPPTTASRGNATISDSNMSPTTVYFMRTEQQQYAKVRVAKREDSGSDEMPAAMWCACRRAQNGAAQRGAHHAASHTTSDSPNRSPRCDECAARRGVLMRSIFFAASVMMRCERRASRHCSRLRTCRPDVSPSPPFIHPSRCYRRCLPLCTCGSGR